MFICKTLYKLLIVALAASCFLHNFCIKHKDIFDENLEENEEADDFLFNDIENGNGKREMICYYLSNI